MSRHIWYPTTNTLAVYKCENCPAVGFSPHPLPKDGCPTETGIGEDNA